MNKFKLWMKRLLLYGMVAPIALLIVSFIAWNLFVWTRNMYIASVPKSDFKEMSVEKMEKMIYTGDKPRSELKKMSFEQRREYRSSDEMDFYGAKRRLKGEYFCLSGNIFLLSSKAKLAILVSDKIFEGYRAVMVFCHMSDRADVEKLESGPWLARVKIYGKCTSMFNLQGALGFSVVNLYGVSVDTRDQQKYSEYTAKEFLKIKQTFSQLCCDRIAYNRRCELGNGPTPEQEKESIRMAKLLASLMQIYFCAPDYLKITGTITDIKSIDEQGSIYDRKLIMQCKGTEYEDSIKNVLTPKLEFTVWPLLKKVNCFAHVYEEFYRKKVGDTVTIYVNLNNMSDANDSYDIMYFEEVSPEQKALAEKEAKYPEPAKAKSKGK